MNKIFIGSIVIFLLAFLVIIYNVDTNVPITNYEDTNIACLPNGHQNIASHIHSKLSITVDGKPEIIPANIGINQNCMSEIHTHDETGEIHVETTQVSNIDKMTLNEFFIVWKKEILREGYNLKIIQDGKDIESAADVKLIDNSKIELVYTTNS
jgi:hypothetical protein